VFFDNLTALNSLKGDLSLSFVQKSTLVGTVGKEEEY